MKSTRFDSVCNVSRLAIALALLCVSALACSFSYSSESSADSSNNSSESSVHSSDSSSPSKEQDEHARFEDDVEQYTVAFLDAGGTEGESFFSGLGDLARSHGVSDWESDASTWEAIGRGLARSPASEAERVAYQAAWTGGDTAKQIAVAKGFSAEQ